MADEPDSVKETTPVRDDLLTRAYKEQVAMYRPNDKDRKRFGLHNLVADLMAMAAAEGVCLIDLISEGVDLYEQRGGGTLDLPGGGPKAFLLECSKAIFR